MRCGDPHNPRDFPGGFPNHERNAFTKAGRTAAENDVFEHLKRLAKLRAETPALRTGSLVQVYDAEQQTVYARVLGDQFVFVAFNNDAKPATVEFDYADAGVPAGAQFKEGLHFFGDGPEIKSHAGHATVNFPTRGQLIIVVQLGSR